VTASPTPEPSAEPSTEPTVAPTFPVCDSEDALNIAFLMDESGSVDSEEWDVIVNFVDRIATYDVAGPSYVSLFEYASLPAFTQFLDWTSITTDRDDVTSALNRNRYTTPGLTYTWDAVNRVLDEFWSYRKNCTDGCETRHDILFLLTDGAPTDEVCPDMMERANTTTVDIVIIGIGTTAESASNWMSQIECLDIANDMMDIYYVEQFESGDFNEIERNIRNYTCSGKYLPTPGDRGGAPWVYDDGSIGLGPVPTSSGDGNAPMDSTPSPQIVSADAIPMMNELKRDLKILDKLPSSNVFIVVGVMAVVLAVFALFCFGFRCKREKSYKRVDFEGDMVSDLDSDTDVEAAQPMNL